ncbi:hypothetical protein [Streptomyces luteolus]|uniref:Uncharacterized protein n=1 Tax=Streptomyces luteolus TaxID=3043615 RepID=A0ABT6T9N8_9ACTN|nr:hypothetical protein [Streptomyces sp. B-S-A12]MDI3424120.1 hypothetical protein [Streptomyces sp. B-S-A12]
MHSPSRHKAAQADHTRAHGNAALDEMNRVVKELSLLPPAPASHETLRVECRQLRDYLNALHESIATDDATLRRDARRLLDVQAWPSQDATRTWAIHRDDLGRLARKYLRSTCRRAHTARTRSTRAASAQDSAGAGVAGEGLPGRALHALRPQYRRRTARRALLLRQEAVNRHRRRNLGEAAITALIVTAVITTFSVLLYQVVTRP